MRTPGSTVCGMPSVMTGAWGVAPRALPGRRTRPTGIRVDVVSPGPVGTPPYSKTGIFTDAIASWAEGAPPRRVGAPADSAGAVASLASDAVGRITGDTLLVSGGIGAHARTMQVRGPQADQRPRGLRRSAGFSIPARRSDHRLGSGRHGCATGPGTVLACMLGTDRRGPGGDGGPRRPSPVRVVTRAGHAGFRVRARGRGHSRVAHVHRTMTSAALLIAAAASAVTACVAVQPSSDAARSTAPPASPPDRPSGPDGGPVPRTVRAPVPEVLDRIRRSRPPAPGRRRAGPAATAPGAHERAGGPPGAAPGPLPHESPGPPAPVPRTPLPHLPVPWVPAQIPAAPAGPLWMVPVRPGGCGPGGNAGGRATAC
ncbi:hypothetical protein GCM10018793_51170 [Streptomyces sulfonofaciens]|uniref:Uncharacterized protein n=1 Tax=Streptomyces sulfonofaciens TaxID=68272 RepID=A0A919GID7_9ACTN|nr:hypothetical protein GCM10018793_51170 [Streptomyces sulfonofaciens]